MRVSNISELLTDINTMKWKLASKGILVGFVAGILVVLYRLGIEFAAQKAILLYAYLKLHPLSILPWLLAALFVGLLTHLLIKWEPYAKGSGIPQVEGIVLFGMKMKWLSILIVRFCAGILTSFFGLSLGREGPSIQIGACGSQAIAKKICKNKLEENFLITAGASAGLSAAFNAPLSGIMFALEEIHRSFSPHILIAATTASLTADVVSKYVFGLETVLHFTVSQLEFSFYIWLPVLGLLSGVLGAMVNKLLLNIHLLFEKFPLWARPFLSLLLALPCGLFLPEVLGGGQNLIHLSEQAAVGISMLLVFLLVKILFTATSFGSGIPGGIFMPILAIGAASGSIMAMAAGQVGLPAEYIPIFCICAMAGVLSATVKAPITSILLMVEMTGSLVHILPVAAVAFLALLTSDLLKTSPIYEVLLERINRANQKQDTKPKNCSILEISVDPGSKADGKRIKDLSWPDGALIVSLRRGEKEIVPNGNTKILHGDYLVVLSSSQQFQEMNLNLLELCHS